MRYSQPFGTPTPPLGVYPRYINGNPVTGTEGSIPPNTAFDEDQIEIVTVIQNAGLTPDHNDLTQLWQAIQSLIAQKYITTAITKTVHGAGSDFVDLFAAFKWLAQYIITNTGSVVFMVAPGRWTYTTTVEVNHPNMNRVTVQGGALLGASPTPANLSVTGYHASADGTNQVIYLRSVYATELSFTGGVTAFAILQAGITLRYLLITGSQTIGTSPGAYPAGDGIYALAELFLDGIAIWGFGLHGLDIMQTSVICVSALSVTIAYCGNCGINCQGGLFNAASDTAYTNVVSNNVTGVNSLGALLWFGRLYVAGHGPPNGNAAIQSLQGGLIVANPGSQLQINQAGMILAGAASCLFESATINNHATYGIDVYGTATLWINNSTLSNNTQYDLIASDGAFVDATGASMTIWTPPFNTYNTNNGAFIVH